MVIIQKSPEEQFSVRVPFYGRVPPGVTEIELAVATAIDLADESDATAIILTADPIHYAEALIVWVALKGGESGKTYEVSTLVTGNDQVPSVIEVKFRVEVV